MGFLVNSTGRRWFGSPLNARQIISFHEFHFLKVPIFETCVYLKGKDELILTLEL